MNPRLVGPIAACVATLLAFAPPVALACQYNPDITYDSLKAAEAFVVRARVSSFAQPYKDGVACYEASYEVLEIFSGKPPGDSFALRQCTKADYPPVQAPQATEIEKSHGFVKGAEVLAGFTTKPVGKGVSAGIVEPGALRMLVPYCWGPFHFRTDLMPEAERTEFLAEFRASLADEAAK